MNTDRLIDGLIGHDSSLRRLYYDDEHFHQQIDNLAGVLMPALVRALAAECRRDADDRRARMMELRREGGGLR